MATPAPNLGSETGEAAFAFVTRFAPSPTGRLHLGHAYSALVGHEAARRAGGRFLLRIEDIDKDRCRPQFEQAIYEDLSWLGLEWDPVVRRQSDHLSDYQKALDQLHAQGVLYRCFRTRKELLDDIARAPHTRLSPVTPGPLTPQAEARALNEDKPFAWRLSLEEARQRLGPAFDALTVRQADVSEDGVTSAAMTDLSVDPDRSGDVIIARKGLGVSYHLAVVVDDALQGITHVLRGEDLREALPIQRLLQALLGLPSPAYGHHRLIVDTDGQRLAKRAGSKSLADLRAGGADPQALRRSLGFAGQSQRA